MSDSKDLTFGKAERLKSKIEIAQLFERGKSLAKFPLRLIYLALDNDKDQHKIGVSVSKRNFQKAVDRNHIKRLLRESYRKNKHLIFNKSTTSYAILFLYIGKSKPNYQTLDDNMARLLKELLKKELNT
jgi:ribonuclease P protein component